MHVCMLSRFSHVRLSVTPWTVAHWDPLSVGLSRQELLEWVAIALLQRIFPTQGLNPCLSHLLHWQEGSLPLVLPRKPFMISSKSSYFPGIPWWSSS